MTTQSYEILQYLKDHNGATAAEVAEALQMEKRRVDSYFSAAIMRAGLGERDTLTMPSRLVLNEQGLLYTQ